jgi:hypothetical protein
MKRLLAILVIVTLLGAFSTMAVSAAASGPPAADGWTDINAPDTVNNTVYLWIRGSTTACTVTNRTYLRWDLTSVSDGTTIASATLTLNANALSGDFTTARNVTLYQVATDSWNETTLTWNNQPAIGSAIQTVQVSATGQVAFNAAGLASYLDTQAKGDNQASFALQMTGDCTSGSAGVRFDSKETTSAALPNLAMSNPTAVDMSAASAQRTSWPLYVGLAAVALFVVAGVMISRRRTA